MEDAKKGRWSEIQRQNSRSLAKHAKVAKGEPLNRDSLNREQRIFRQD